MGELPPGDEREHVVASMGPGFVSREWGAGELVGVEVGAGASMGPGFVSREWARTSPVTRSTSRGFNGARLREPGVGVSSRAERTSRSSFDGARLREPGVGCDASEGRRAGGVGFNGARLREPGVGVPLTLTGTADYASMGPGFVSREWDTEDIDRYESLAVLQWGPAS